MKPSPLAWLVCGGALAALGSACSGSVTLSDSGGTTGSGAAGSTSTGGGAVTGMTGVTGSGAGGTGGTTPVGNSPNCMPQQVVKLWASMNESPITPPDHAALLGLAGLTVHGAEQILCPGNLLGDQGGGTSVEAWGYDNEVWLGYTTATMKATVLTLWPGYHGTVAFKSPDGTNAYQIAIGTQLSRNGAPIILDWSNKPLFAQEVDELCRGLVATFTNGAPDPPGTTCVESGKCIVGTFGDAGYVEFEPLGLSVWVGSVTAAQPAPSIPSRLDLFPL